MIIKTSIQQINILQIEQIALPIIIERIGVKSTKKKVGSIFNNNLKKTEPQTNIFNYHAINFNEF